MATEQVWNQFSAGWTPSDDAVNGRKNALLRMDNVELDKNGSLSLVGGVQVEIYYATGTPIEMVATTIAGEEVFYSANNDGSIYREYSSIATGGSTSVACFGSAFNYTLACSGSARVKDDGTNTYQLGLNDLVAPTLSLVAGNYTAELVVDGSTVTWSYLGGASSGTQSTPVFSFSTLSDTSGYITMGCAGTLPTLDWTTLPNGGSGSVLSSPNDIIQFSLTAVTESLDFWNQIIFTINTAGGASFSCTKSVNQSNVTGSWSFYRSDFAANNGITGLASWASVSSFSITLVPGGSYPTAIQITLSGTIIPIVDTAVTPYSKHFAFYRGINTLLTPQLISYAILAVATSTSYVATSSPFDATQDYVSIWVPTGADVQLAITASTDPQVNGVWVYRQGANLAQWYRTLVVVNTTGNYIDNLQDSDALGIDLVLNLNLESVHGTGTLDIIRAIIGPMEGKWFYFDTNFMYPSDINDPDLVDVSLGVRTCGSNNEIFLWAVIVAEGYILVGTTKDIYVLSGTFTTLADGSIDIYYRPLVCQHPPVSIDNTFNAGLVYYMAADGWRSIGTDASTSTLLVAPNTDQLYNGVERYGYTPALQNTQVPGTLRFPVIVTNNKLWCCVGNRIEVWDFTRNYWRVVQYGLGQITAITKNVIGLPVIGYTSNGTGTAARIDSPYTPYIVETGAKQTVNILSSVFNPSGQLNRNDLYTLKVRLLTGIGEELYINLVTADGTSYEVGGVSVFSSEDIEQEVSLDVYSVITEPQVTWQYSLTGAFSKFVLADIRIEYDPRPNPLTSLRLAPNNFGVAAKKRVRMWPHTIDTLGQNITFTPVVDGVLGVAQTINTSDRTTVPIFFNWDAFGTDYGAYITGGPFEYYGEGQPEVVQTLPTPKQYDQVGPKELFRYGKVREFELRLLPLLPIGGTSVLPLTFYFDDYSLYTNFITVNNGLEQTYSFGVPKGTSGSIVRVELGPTTYQFVRYSLRIRVTKHGADSTDNSSWISL